MKLFEVPRNTKIRILEDPRIPPASNELPENGVFYFHHIDGMYSLCTDMNNIPHHLAAWTEVEIIIPQETGNESK